MLLVNQTKDLVLNLDTITALYIEKKTCSIKARVIGDEVLPFHLGTYQSLDDCKKVLDDILYDYNMKELRFEMPLGGAVK